MATGAQEKMLHAVENGELVLTPPGYLAVRLN